MYTRLFLLAFLLSWCPATVLWSQGPLAAGVSQGDGLPAGALLRMGSTRLRHPTMIQSVAFAPDGKTVASADYNGTVRLWDVQTGRQRRELPGKAGNFVAFSPDGKTLASCGSYLQPITLWDAATGDKLRELAQGASSLSFSGDGKRLAAVGGGGVIGLWDPATGAQVRTFKGHVVALSRDGTMLASSGGSDTTAAQHGEIRLWDAEQGRELRRLEGHKNQVNSLAFSRDGKTLASASAHAVRVWDVERGRERFRLDKCNYAVTFSPAANHLATAGAFGVYNPDTAQQLVRLEGDLAEAQCLAYSADGTLLATGDRQGQLRLWNAATGKELVRRTGHEHGVRAVAFSADGAVAASTSGGDHTLRLWGTTTGAQLRKLDIGCMTPDHWCKNDGAAIFFRNDRTVGTWACDGMLHLWELAGVRRRELRLGERWVACVTMSRDGTLLAVAAPDDSRRTPVKLIEVDGGKEVRILEPFKPRASSDARITSLAFSPDGKLLAVGLSERGPGGRPGQRAVEETIQLWDVGNGKQVRSFRRAENAPGMMVFSPDGKLLASAATGTAPLQLWEVATGEEVRRFGEKDANRAWYQSCPCAFAPDGKVLAGAGKNHEIAVWEIATGGAIRTFRGHTKAVTALAFSPDGTALLSGSEDATVLLWDLGAPPKGAPGPAKQLDGGQRRRCWNDLAEADAAVAYRAIEALTGAPDQAVALLRQRLKPAPARDPARLPQLLAELGHAEAARREAAAAELKQFGIQAAPALYAALGGKPAVDVRRQIEHVLETIGEFPISPDELRYLRAVQVLERLGSPAAEQLLQTLAGGDARAALQRLQARRRVPSLTVLSEEEAAAARRPLVGSRPVRSPGKHEGTVYTLSFSPDGKLLATGGRDSSLCLWDSASNQLVRKLAGSEQGVWGLAFAPGGRQLAAAGADRRVRIWDPADGALLRTLEAHTDCVACVAYSPDGKVLASGGYDGAIRLWDPATGVLLRTLPTDARRVTAVAFAPDGRTLASGGVTPEQAVFGGQATHYTQPATVELWDPATGRRRQRLPLRGTEITFAPDGRTLVAAGSFYRIDKQAKGRGFVSIGGTTLYLASQIQWWDLAHQAEIRSIPHQAAAVALGPDGRTLAAAGGHLAHHDTLDWGTNKIYAGVDSDGTVRLWETATGQEAFKGMAQSATAVACSPDGRTLAWGTEKGEVLVWDLAPLDSLAAHPGGLPPSELDRLWDALAGAEAAPAYQAQWTLAGGGPSTVAFLRARLTPATSQDEKQLRQLVADLDSNQFAVRQAAAEKLRALGHAAEAVLSEALHKRPSVEMDRRLRELLQGIRSLPPVPDELRGLRAIPVLAEIGSPEARKVLEFLSPGAPSAPQTRAARQALKSWRDR